MGYPDFPIPDQSKSYIPQKDMLTFLELYAQKFNVYPHIKFEHFVIRVRPYNDEDQWEIIVRDLPNNTYNTYIFDAIIVCNGHYHTPAMPKYPGKELYKGQQIHSHNYRSADPFTGKTMSFLICILKRNKTKEFSICVLVACTMFLEAVYLAKAECSHSIQAKSVYFSNAKTHINTFAVQ